MELSPTQQLVRGMYKDEKGDPIDLSNGQDELFAAIAMARYPRIHAMSHTRWGKSMTVGLSALTRCSTFPEKCAIIAGTKPKAKIIMDYVIGHIFDNDWTASRFMPEKGETVQDIRRYKNKNHLTFLIDTIEDSITGKKIARYGEIFIGSAKDALGFGAQIVIEDEAALIEDPDHALVMRMLGDNIKDNRFIKIGNPFQRNHFLESYRDPRYHKIIIDCYRSLQEGRITQEIIDENRNNAYFSILYECKFPSAQDIDESGWQYLLSDRDLDTALKRELEPVGKRRLGVDVARAGRNYSVLVMRTDNTAQVLARVHAKDLIGSSDTVGLAEIVAAAIRDNGIEPKEVYIDDSGVGGGLTDFLKSRGLSITPVILGSNDVNDLDCANVRSDVYAGRQGVASWIKSGAKLVPHAGWTELTRIRYKKNMSGKTLIEGKDDMLKRGIESPDVADALALTFAKSKKSIYHGIDPNQIIGSPAPSNFMGDSPNQSPWGGGDHLI